MADSEIQANVIKHGQRDMSADPAMSHDQASPGVAAKPPARKIGAEHVKGMIKLGAHELTQALAAFPDSNIRPMEEPGVFGNETMPHLTGEKSAYERSLDQYAARANPDKDQSRTV